MEAIILAGGKGTRLQAVVNDRPKPMALIHGRPFLELLLESLDRKGVRRAILCTGYMAESISNHFGTTYGRIQLDYLVETIPLGTGGAIRQALPYCRDDHALVLNGDTFLDLRLDAIESLWQYHRQPIIVVRQVADTDRYGRIETRGDRVTAFREKGVKGPGLINAGCYVLPTDLAAAMPSSSFSIEADFLVPEVDRRFFIAHLEPGTFIDIGIPEDYERAQNLLTEGVILP